MDFEEFEGRLEGLISDVAYLKDQPEYNDVVARAGKVHFNKLEKALKEAMSQLEKFRKREGL